MARKAAKPEPKVLTDGSNLQPYVSDVEMTDDSRPNLVPNDESTDTGKSSGLTSNTLVADKHGRSQTSTY